MNLRERIRDYLGIYMLKEDIQLAELKLKQLDGKLNNLQTTINTVVTPGIARTVAKLDPISAASEFDPKRKAESDRLADEVIKRLQAEAAARAPYNERDDG